MLKTHFPQPNPPLYISNCAPPIQACERQTLRAGLRGGATANAGTATGIDRGGGQRRRKKIGKAKVILQLHIYTQSYKEL